MENFTLKIKQLRVPGMDLLRFFSIVLLLAFVAIAGTRTDTLYTSGGAYLTRLSTPSAGITRANIDTSKTRHATADSATIPVLKGHTTKRDSTTFTGGIRGVRLSMDSIFNLTGKSGSVQYLSSTKKFIDAPIYTNGTNVSIGKNSVEAWSTGNFALQIGGASAILTKASEMQNGTYYMNNAYNDNSGFKPFVNGAAAIYSTSSADGSHIWFSNTGLTADIAFTPTVTMSLSAGGFLNLPSLTASRAIVTDGSKNIVSSSVTNIELGYLSGKNSVIDGSGTSGKLALFTGTNRIGNGPAYNSGTGTVTGNITGKADTARAAGTATNVSGGTANVTSLTLNGGSALTAYNSGSFPCTLKTSVVTVQQIGTAYWTKIGNVFTCSFPYLSGTSNSTLLRMYCSIPYKPKQMSGSSNVDNRAIPAVDNGSPIVCFVDVFQVSGFIAFQNSGGVFTNSGIKSVLPFSVTYITED